MSRTIQQLVSNRIAEDEQLYQVSRTDLFLNFNWVRSSGYISEPLVQVLTSHVPITVRRKPTPDRAQALNCLIQFGLRWRMNLTIQRLNCLFENFMSQVRGSIHPVPRRYGCRGLGWHSTTFLAAPAGAALSVIYVEDDVWRAWASSSWRSPPCLSWRTRLWQTWRTTPTRFAARRVARTQRQVALRWKGSGTVPCSTLAGAARLLTARMSNSFQFSSRCLPATAAHVDVHEAHSSRIVTWTCGAESDENTNTHIHTNTHTHTTQQTNIHTHTLDTTRHDTTRHHTTPHHTTRHDTTRHDTARLLAVRWAGGCPRAWKIRIATLHSGGAVPHSHVRVAA